MNQPLISVNCTLDAREGHFMTAGCDHCNARRVRHMTLERVEDWYNYGNIDQDLYEAYMHCWATMSPRHSSLGDGWTQEPTSPRVAALVTLIRAAS